jgi:hypothetical protein
MSGLASVLRLTRARAIAAACALVAVQAGMLAWAAYDKSDTIDEPTYLAAAALM